MSLVRAVAARLPVQSRPDTLLRVSDRQPQILQQLIWQVQQMPSSERSALVLKLSGDNESLRIELCRLLEIDPETVDVPMPAPSADVGGCRGADPPTLKVAGYRLMSFLGGGGQGTVWEAEHLYSRRCVALKLSVAVDPESETGRRFQREVELASQLSHPGIARVFDGGVDGSFSYYAMELVRGVPLDKYAANMGGSTQSMVGIMVSVCDAVGYAHANGVVHRDLKPSNIMISEESGVSVVDFGLAKRYDLEGSDARLTSGRHVGGSVMWMSPEQAGGEFDQLDPRSDVFTLGLILHKLLVGHLPFQKRRLAAGAAANAGILEPDLQAILNKCLALDPENRYQNATELRDDLKRYAGGAETKARPLTAAQRLVRWGRLPARHRQAGVVQVLCSLVFCLFHGAYLVVALQLLNDRIVLNTRIEPGGFALINGVSMALFAVVSVMGIGLYRGSTRIAWFSALHWFFYSLFNIGVLTGLVSFRASGALDYYGARLPLYLILSSLSTFVLLVVVLGLFAISAMKQRPLNSL